MAGPLQVLYYVPRNLQPDSFRSGHSFAAMARTIDALNTLEHCFAEAAGQEGSRGSLPRVAIL